VELGHAVRLHERVELEGERHPGAPVAGLEVETGALHVDLGVAGAFRPPTVNGMSTAFVVATLVETFRLRVRQRARLLPGLELPLLLLEDRVVRALEHAAGHARLEEEALEVAAELGVAFLEGAEVGGPVVERAQVPRMSPRGSPPRIAPCSISSGGQFIGTVRTTLLRPSSDACFQNEVPPRVERTSGRFTGRKPHLKTAARSSFPCSDRQVGLQVALQEVVDVVLARVHAGGEAGPGHRRLRRLRRLELRERSLLGEPLQVRELAFVHPLAGEVGSMPSKPSTKTRCLARRTGLPEEEEPAAAQVRRGDQELRKQAWRESIRRF
jgi:hypothetical protein